MTALGTPPPAAGAPATGGGPAASATPVVGDGTTAAGRARRRWRAVRWWAVVLAAMALVVGALAVTRPATSTTPYAPDNAQADGARAVAQVLADQGVAVEHVTTVDDAVRAATEGTTLLVTPTALLAYEQADALAAVPADLVLLGADDVLLGAATDGAVRRGGVLDTSPDVLAPDCPLPAARAAGEARLTASLTLVPSKGGPGPVTCYPEGGGAALVAVADGGRTVTAVDDPSLVRNDTVLEAGNAALALHLLGAHERLVWLVPDPFDLSTGDGTGGAAAGPSMPRWAGAVGLWAGLVVLVLALWRGRRLGPLVAEELPVVVPAAEAARGRGRLYRRTRARGHAAAGLRAATATRVAARLGLPRSAEPAGVVDAVVRASGRDPREVAALLYGPPPADDEALTELARRLDGLERDTAGRGAARPAPARGTPGAPAGGTPARDTPARDTPARDTSGSEDPRS